MVRKTLVTLALTAGFVAASTGVASAHTCYVANRSDQGNAAAAAHSPNWETLTLEQLFATVHEQPFGVPKLTDEEIAEAVAMAEAQGIPSEVTIFIRRTLPRSSSDGKGIDHFFAQHGQRLVGIAFDVTR